MYVFYVMPRTYGSVFGLIAWPLGICAPNSKKNFHQQIVIGKPASVWFVEIYKEIFDFD